MNLFEELKTKVKDSRDGKRFYLCEDIKVARVLSLLLAYLNGKTYKQCETRTSTYPGRIYDMARFMSNESGAPKVFFEKWFLNGDKTFYEIEEQDESKKAMKRRIDRLKQAVDIFGNRVQSSIENKKTLQTNEKNHSEEILKLRLEANLNMIQLYTQRLHEAEKSLERALAYKKYME